MSNFSPNPSEQSQPSGDLPDKESPLPSPTLPANPQSTTHRNVTINRLIDLKLASDVDIVLTLNNQNQGELKIQLKEIEVSFIIGSKITDDTERGKKIAECLRTLRQLGKRLRCNPDSDEFQQTTSIVIKQIAIFADFSSPNICSDLFDNIQKIVAAHNTNLQTNCDKLILKPILPTNQNDLELFTANLFRGKWDINLSRDSLDPLQWDGLIMRRADSKIFLIATSSGSSIPKDIPPAHLQNSTSIKIGDDTQPTMLETKLCDAHEVLSGSLNKLTDFCHLLCSDKIDVNNGESLSKSSNLTKKLLEGTDFKISKATNLTFEDVDLLGIDLSDTEFISCEFLRCTGAFKAFNLKMKNCAIKSSHLIFVDSNNFSFINGFCDESSSISGVIKNARIAPIYFAPNLLGSKTVPTDMTGTSFICKYEEVKQVFGGMKLYLNTLSDTDSSTNSINANIKSSLSQLSSGEVIGWENKNWLNEEVALKRLRSCELLNVHKKLATIKGINPKVAKYLAELHDSDIDDNVPNSINQLPYKKLTLSNRNIPNSDIFHIFIDSSSKIDWRDMGIKWNSVEQFRINHIYRLITFICAEVPKWNLNDENYIKLKKITNEMNDKMRAWHSQINSPDADALLYFEYRALRRFCAKNIPKIIVLLNKIENETNKEDWKLGSLRPIEKRWGELHRLKSHLASVKDSFKSLVTDFEIEERLKGMDAEFNKIGWIRKKIHQNSNSLTFSKFDRFLISISRYIPYSKIREREYHRHIDYLRTRAFNVARANFGNRNTLVPTYITSHSKNYIIIRTDYRGNILESKPTAKNNANSFNSAARYRDLLQVAYKVKCPGWIPPSPNSASQDTLATVRKF